MAIWREPEGYERLTPGTRVRTLEDAGRKDWVLPRSVQWGVDGVVTGHHDSHGLCYDVKHPDGSVGCYDPDEVEVAV